MERPNVLTVLALITLVATAIINLLIYDISLMYSILFFAIPVALGIYGVLNHSRAFILSAAASLLLVSLRPDTGESMLMVPFVISFIVFLESSEASIRMHTVTDEVARKNYTIKGSIVVCTTIVFSVGVYYLAPLVTNFMGKAAGSAAILDTVQLPLIVGLVVLASLAIGGLALRH